MTVWSDECERTHALNFEMLGPWQNIFSIKRDRLASLTGEVQKAKPCSDDDALPCTATNNDE